MLSTKTKEEKHSTLEEELRQIKTLLMLLLIKQGATSDEINAVLHVNVRNLIPMRKLKKGIIVRIESDEGK